MKLWYKVLAGDLLFVFAFYSVLQDLSWRTYYAASPHDACGGLCTYTPSFSYGFLTRTFTLAGNNASLVSPPTLDWVQVIIYTLVLVNLWLVYVTLKPRVARRSMTPAAPVQ